MELDLDNNYKESSYDTELNFHAVNMRSRFPNPPDRNRTSPASWKDKPYFYRVSRGMYKLLTESDKKDFELAVKKDLDIIYKDDYEFGLLKNKLGDRVIENKEASNKDFSNIEGNRKKNNSLSVSKIKNNKKLNKDLKKLSDSIKEKNKIELTIAKVIDRPAIIGHAGEYIASKIFYIDLETSAVTRSIDGYFSEGNIKGKSVNIKWYGKKENLLDITPDYLPDYYLVMTGPSTPAISSRGCTRPWSINSVFLFNSVKLVNILKSFGIKIGIATSVRSYLWDEAEIFPNQRNPELVLSDEQISMLNLFKMD